MTDRDTTDWPTIDDYPSIRTWTDIMIAEFPTVMRAVVDRPFGDLHCWIEDNWEDPKAQPRGCFVGTTEILMNELLSCITVKRVIQRDISVDLVMQDFLLQCKREAIGGMTPKDFGQLTDNAGMMVSDWTTHVRDENEDEVSDSEAQEYVVQQIKNYIRSRMSLEPAT
jgi:hypothetical protein